MKKSYSKGIHLRILCPSATVLEISRKSCPQRAPARYQGRSDHPETGHLRSYVLSVARAIWLTERPRGQGIKATERREFSINAIGGGIEPG